ncbi:MAG: FAD:protein FMN transferase [Candidatus Eisenbacteria bacterium]
MARHSRSGAALALLLLCALPVQAAGLQRARWLMGTLWSVAAPCVPADSMRCSAALDAALDEVAALEVLLSNWSATSALSRLNAAGAADALPEPLFAVIDSALTLAALTHGAFDPTVEPLTRAWDLRGEGRVPAERELAGALAHTGWARVVLEPAARGVRLNGTQLDLGGIAKGFALDRAARVLAARGVSTATLDAGGQRLAIACTDTVWVAEPGRRDVPAASLALTDASLSTSAQSERFVTVGGRRHGHVVDPRTGRPVANGGSVSVRAASATRADALSTALLVLGRAPAQAFATARPELGVLWLEPAHGHVLAHAWNLSLLRTAARVVPTNAALTLTDHR